MCDTVDRQVLRFRPVPVFPDPDEFSVREDRSLIPATMKTVNSEDRVPVDPEDRNVNDVGIPSGLPTIGIPDAA